MGVKDFPLVLPLVLHGKFIFSKLPGSSEQSLLHVPFRAHAPILQMLLLSSVRAGYRSTVGEKRERCVF